MKQLFLILSLLILLGAGGYIVYSILENNQAPDEVAANSLCCDRGRCADGTEFEQDVTGGVGNIFPSCEARAQEACSDQNGDGIGDFTSAPTIQCPGSGSGGDSGENVRCITDTTSITGGTVKAIDFCDDIPYVEFIEDANGRNSSEACVGTSGGQVSRRTVSSPFERNVRDVTNECGKCVQIDLINPDQGNREFGSAYYTGDCASPPQEDPPAEDPPAEDPPAEEPPVEDPPAEDPPGDTSIDLVCGDPGFEPGPNQCANPGTEFCDEQCNPIAVETPINLTLLKTALSTCLPDSIQSISYSITVTNTGSNDAQFSGLFDDLPTGITESQLRNISNNGTVETVSGNLRINWTPVTIAPGNSISYTYNILLASNERLNLPANIENNVTMVYEDNGEENEIDFVHREPLRCDRSSSLPETDMQDYIMYVVAGFLVLLAAWIYKTGLFSNHVAMSLSILGDQFARLKGRRYKLSKFEGKFDD